MSSTDAGKVAPENVKVTTSVHAFVKNNRRILDELPKKSPWLASTTKLNGGELGKAESSGVIEKIGHLNDHYWELDIWCLTDAARVVLKESASDNIDYRMPCGHYGFENPRDSEFYRCKECGGRFTRDEMEEA
jgi:hypothetical protein